MGVSRASVKLNQRNLMERAIQLAMKCKSEGGQPRPKVGALLAVNDAILVEGFRGETAEGDHAEYVILGPKKPSTDLAEASLYTTLELCTHRGHPKIACCQRVIEAGIKHVVIGMVDPNE